ncbi:MAG: hypothetical protein H6Q75_716 [Firmicutes bacterium]|nr:hypothetical protein [Bacillota bacterium]
MKKLATVLLFLFTLSLGASVSAHELSPNWVTPPQQMSTHHDGQPVPPDPQPVPPAPKKPHHHQHKLPSPPPAPDNH